MNDLTNTLNSMKQLLAQMQTAIQAHLKTNLVVYPGEHEVSVAENYDILGYPIDNPSRDKRYTRYLDNGNILRTQMSAVIPSAMQKISPPSIIWSPGMVYRRDSIDKLHVGQPHQLDCWYITEYPQTREDLLKLVEVIVYSSLGEVKWRANETEHPYTLDGIEIEVLINDQWVEIGECGLVDPQISKRLKLDKPVYGLASGWGLDRLLMLKKNIPDIRLLRSQDPRVMKQLQDLQEYVDVSSQPPASRDISIAINNDINDEDIGDMVRNICPEHLDWIEEISIQSLTPQQNLHPNAIERLGLRENQNNALIRIVLRHPTQSIKKNLANQIRDKIAHSLHQGSKKWSS